MSQNQTPESSRDRLSIEIVRSADGLVAAFRSAAESVDAFRTAAFPESPESERPEGVELWQFSLWLKPGAASEVCEQIAALEGVAELYRAWKTSED